MKPYAIILVLLLCVPASASQEASEVEATTAITLPVDSVTIYPDGLMAVKRTGLLDVTEGATSSWSMFRIRPISALSFSR